MQELTVASVTPKGTGDKTFYVVKGTEGEDLTTFDAAAAGWGRGTKLNVEIKVKGKYTNIAKWEMVALMPVGDLPPDPTAGTDLPFTQVGYGDDPAKRLSIERQSSAATILTYVAAALAAGHTVVETSETYRAQEKAIAWLSSRFDDTPSFTLTVAPTPASKLDADIARNERINQGVDQRTQADKDFNSLGQECRFKNVGELLAWCGKEGIDRDTFLGIVSAKDTTNLDVAEAYQQVKDYLKGG